MGRCAGHCSISDLVLVVVLVAPARFEELRLLLDRQHHAGMQQAGREPVPLWLPSCFTARDRCEPLNEAGLMAFAAPSGPPRCQEPAGQQVALIVRTIRVTRSWSSGSSGISLRRYSVHDARDME